MFRTLDLFAGAGGLSYGFEMTGEFEVVAAVELNKYARATYRRNHSSKQLELYNDIRALNFSEMNERLHIDVVIGGPPCQGFSNANRQKNHIVNMNNALVKEFFRAIKEIKPVAFVMENVSMLASDTHRFYDSSIDHDEIEKYGIESRPDEIVISVADDSVFDLLSSNYESHVINPQLVHMLRVWSKKRGNAEKEKKFINNHKTELTKCIVKEIERNTLCFEEKERLAAIIEGIDSAKPIEELWDTLSLVLTVQTALQNLLELKNNSIIYKLRKTDTKIVADVRSYSVIDYIGAILGDEYVHEGVTLNATWFGVPQERKRHIRFGIRKDCAPELMVLPSEPQNISKVSVGEAILDLEAYPVTSNPERAFCEYHNDEMVSKYGLMMRKGSSGVYNHITCKTTEPVLERFKALKEGENFHNLTDDLKTSYANPSRTQNTIYLRLNSQQPSGTVVNVRKSMWIHPKLNRPISVREAARLQSFPDSFVFEGPKDSQYQQVGNAVPPLLAKNVAIYLKNNIKM